MHRILDTRRRVVDSEIDTRVEGTITIAQSASFNAVNSVRTVIEAARVEFPDTYARISRRIRTSVCGTDFAIIELTVIVLVDEDEHAGVVGPTDVVYLYITQSSALTGQVTTSTVADV
ncbi:hypothetical protein [Halorubrum ezzemoulense]|uniref:hypothetical protein n=1 Tax=Halorubrum ezzemoulense TaxID=337243 RepID=UPI000B98DDA4|nr:hypothetical protein [Halorubrum ezzemoulense]